jgi:hypothetical protein
MKLSRLLIFAASLITVLCGLLTSAFAGPPLICHRLDIGDAKSLPWTGDAWNLSGNESYDTKNLTKDTLAILDSGAPVIVRMETLRRATLYARKDPRAAKELLTRLYQRANTEATSAGHDALARFDVGYLAEAYQESFGKEPNPAAGIDGYDLVVKALALSGHNDPEMEFAAALITLHGHDRAHEEHARKAIAGAKVDPLLARNLSSQFRGDPKQTVSEALTQRLTTEEAQK